MKKFLCMLLSAFLLFSALPLVYADDAAEPAADKTTEDTSVSEPVFIEDLIGAAEGTADNKADLFLEQLEVLKAVYPEITIYEDLEGEVSRADFLVMLVQLTVDTGYPLYTGFSDVDSDDTALLDSLGYAVTAGLVSKSDAFRPDDAISYLEMYKMSVVTCGYEPVAQKKGGWPNGYIAVANEIGLTDFLEKTSGSVSAKDAYRLLYNVITVNFLEQTSFGAKAQFTIEKGTSILENRFNVRIVEGIAYANQMTSLTKELSAEGKPTITIGTTTFANKTGKNLLGYNVRAFVYDRDGENELISLRKYKNEEVFVSSFTGMNGFTLEAAMPDGKIEKYKLYKGYSLLLNDIAAPNAKLADYADRDDVTLRLIDNNADGAFDVVKIYTWKYMQVGRVDSVNKLIFNQEVPGQMLDISDREAEYKFYDCTDGVITEIAWEELSEDDTLTYVVSANLKSVLAFRSQAKVTGTCTAANSGEGTVTVDGREYTLSVYAKENYPQLSFGSETTLGLDATGLVVGVSQLDSEYRYAWIVASEKKSALGSDVTVKMFTQSGKMELFPVAKRLYIDNVIKTAEEFYTLERTLVDDRMVKYGLNADGELNMVDFPAVYSGNLPFADSLPERDCFTQYYAEGFNKVGSGAFSDKFMADPSTLFFSVPTTDRLNDEAYLIKNLYSFRNGLVVCNAYDIEPGGGPKVVLTFADLPAISLDIYSGAEVVLDIVQGLNAEGMSTTLIKTYDGSSYNSYSLRDNVSIGALTRGDIIRLTAYNNEIYSFNIDYSFSTDITASDLTPGNGSQTRHIYYKGYVYAYGSRSLHLWDTSDVSADVTLDNLYGLDFREQNIVFVDVYKNSAGKITKVMARYKPISEIKDYLHSGEEADFIVARMLDGDYVKKWIYREIKS